MGADSASTSGDWVAMRRDPKLFRNGPFLIGCTSSWRMAQLLRYRFQPPAQEDWEHDTFGFMATKFVDAVRDCFREFGYSKVENQVDEGGVFLVGYRGGLYAIYGDFQVEVPADDYQAVGSGFAYALGALHGSAALEAADRVASALAAAEKFCGSVRRPFILEVIE